MEGDHGGSFLVLQEINLWKCPNSCLNFGEISVDNLLVMCYNEGVKYPDFFTERGER